MLYYYANERALGTIKRLMVAVGLLFKRTLLPQAAAGVVLIRCCFFSNYYTKKPWTVDQIWIQQKTRFS